MNRAHRAKCLTISSLFFSSLLLAGCGGSSSDNTTATPPPSNPDSKPKPVEPSAPTVKPGEFGLKAITASATKDKTLTFSWSASEGAASYTLCKVKDKDDKSETAKNCDKVGDPVAAPAVTVDYSYPGVTNPTLIDTTYFVIAKNAKGDKVSFNDAKLSEDKYKGLVTYLKATNIAASNAFGHSVAISRDGNTMAVGAPNESLQVKANDGSTATTTENATKSGAVYVFTRVKGQWVTTPTFLRASSKINVTTKNDAFGSAVSLSKDGNTLAVSAPSEDSGDQSHQAIVDETGVAFDPTAAADIDNSGAVYVFTRGSDGKWSTPAFIKASTSDVTSNAPDNGVIAKDANFGSALALSDDGKTLAVADVNTFPSGPRLYVFTLKDSEWTKRAFNGYGSPSTGDGTSLALSSDGKLLAAGNSATSGKKVLVFDFKKATENSKKEEYVLQGSTHSDVESTGIADLSSNLSSFGASIALSGEGTTLVVGAPNAVNKGVAEVLTFSNKKWTARTDKDSGFAPTKGDKLQNFGNSVAISEDGSVVAIGDSGQKSADLTDQTNSTNKKPGAIYIFKRHNTDTNGLTWDEDKTYYLKATNIVTTATDDVAVNENMALGTAIALSGDGQTLVGGAPSEDGNKEGDGTSEAVNKPNLSDSGAVYVY